MRLARVIEGSQTVALLVGAEHIARSAGGATIEIDPAENDRGAARWGACALDGTIGSFAPAAGAGDLAAGCRGQELTRHVVAVCVPSIAPQA